MRGPGIPAPKTVNHCPTCGKRMSTHLARRIENGHTPGFALNAFQPKDDAFYREQAIQQALERIAFFWAGNQINDNTAWSLIRSLVPSASTADIAAIYGTGVAARREWGLIPLEEVRIVRLPKEHIKGLRSNDEPEGAA